MILPGILPRDGQVDVDGDTVGDFASLQSMLARCHSLLRLDLRRSSWRRPDEPTGGAAGYHPAGSPVALNDAGSVRRFVCPYYARAYDRNGQLTGITAEDTFGEVDKSCFGLVEIPVAARNLAPMLSMSSGSRRRATSRNEPKRGNGSRLSLRAPVSSWRSGQTSPYWMLREGMSRWCCSRARKAIAVHARPRCLGHPGTSRHGARRSREGHQRHDDLCRPGRSG
jgi:hypothetical protein